MHIHPSQMNLDAINPWSAAAEKAAAVQRSADVRKKLMKSASDIEGIASPDEVFMVGHWMDSAPNRSQQDVEYHSSTSGKDSDFG
jgi:hypothetical protein